MSDDGSVREIFVRVSGDSVHIQGSDGEEPPKAPLLMDPLRQATIRVLESLLSRNLLEDNREAVEVLGRHLFEALFNGEVYRAFVNYLDSSSPHQRVRIQLTFDDRHEALAALPWEYMYLWRPRGTSAFLSTHATLVLSRFLPLEKKRSAGGPSEEPLRVLLVVSSPDDPTLGPVIAAPVIDEIHHLCATLRQAHGGRDAITLHPLEAPTVEALIDALTQHQPHVVHFFGHGRFDARKGRGEIALLGADLRSAQWCQDSDFAGFLQRLPVKPRLVFLHLCEGGVAHFDESFAGLAPCLVQAGAQAVVAMQYRIRNAHAISFGKAFYQCLAEGKDVDVAVQEGRFQMTVDDPKAHASRAFGTPVLYLHARDAVIRPRPAARPADPRAPSGASGPAPGAPPAPSDPQADERRLREARRAVLFSEVDPDDAAFLAAAQGELMNLASNRTVQQTCSELRRRIAQEPDSRYGPLWQALLVRLTA